MDHSRLIEEAVRFHAWDAMAPAALHGIARRGPFEHTAETGCGGSTLVFSQLSRRHTAFAIEGENGTISNLRKQPGLRSESVEFVEGQSHRTLPVHVFESKLDLVLLDGPHAYPLPQLETAYLLTHVRVGGWLVLDDIQIPSVHELFAFAVKEKFLALEEVAVRTAFFRKVAEFEGGDDGWWLQGMNRSLVWRYSWRDRLRKIVRGR